MTSTGPDARAALDELVTAPAWAVVRVKDAPTVTLLSGTRTEVASLMDVPLEEGPPPAGRSYDRLLAVPFRQVRERGFDALDDKAPLTVVDIDTELEVPLADLLAALPEEELTFTDPGGFESSDGEYADVVRAIIAEEIGQGQGANLVVGRHYRAQLEAWGPAQALSVLRRLLERERGAYWTFVFFTGERYLVGASPERHVSVHGGDVRMNPISGTFRLRDSRADPSGAGADAKQRLLQFLADEKEIYELFMVVDEELKMMCDVCNEGGQVLGPFLKPMTHLVHTEYLLAGRTSRDVREVLRDTMFAATVTGAPVENACRLIARYESEGRGYYGAALALLGRDAEGAPTADSPIVIRTADVSPEGRLKVTAGATLVRDSDPEHEVAETRAKAGGILTAFGLAEAPPQPAGGLTELTRDEDVLIALASRNQRLSRFWLTDQHDTPADPRLRGKRAVIVEGEDDFVNMLAHVLGAYGMEAVVVPHEQATPAALAGYDLVVVGPGPGDPRDGSQPKIAHFRSVVDHLLSTEQPFLAVCLGHQVLCERLGIELAYKDIVFQGTQARVGLDQTLPGREEVVGFYNTFVARPRGPLPAGVTAACDENTGDVHMVAGPHYRGIQFHAESILTEEGFDLLRDVVIDLIG
jgi:2-amino-4-deoxychorismate synthase